MTPRTPGATGNDVSSRHQRLLRLLAGPLRAPYPADGLGLCSRRTEALRDGPVRTDLWGREGAGGVGRQQIHPPRRNAAEAAAGRTHRGRLSRTVRQGPDQPGARGEENRRPRHHHRRAHARAWGGHGDGQRRGILARAGFEGGELGTGSIARGAAWRLWREWGRGNPTMALLTKDTPVIVGVCASLAILAGLRLLWPRVVVQFIGHSLKKRDFKRAIFLANRLISKTHNAEYLRLRATAKWNLQDYAGALSDLDAAIHGHHRGKQAVFPTTPSLVRTTMLKKADTMTSSAPSKRGRS